MAICPIILGGFLGNSALGATGDVTSDYLLYVSDCLEDKCQWWDSEYGDCSLSTNSGHNLKLANIHDAHWHPTAHQASNLSTSGGPTMSSEPPKATKLMNEFMGNEDMDGNGLVYGYDFKITDSATKPPMLSAVEANPNWTDPDTEMSWEDYLASL